MPKLMCLASQVGGIPNVSDLLYNGSVCIDTIGNIGAFIISGSGAELLAINALPQVMGIVDVTEKGDVRWPQISDIAQAADRIRINNYLTAHGQPTVSAGWSYKQILEAIFTRINSHYNLALCDVALPESAVVHYIVDANGSRLIDNAGHYIVDTQEG